MVFLTDEDDDDVYLGYYSGKLVSYKLPCLHVLRKTHKLSRYGISNSLLIYPDWSTGFVGRVESVLGRYLLPNVRNNLRLRE
jgi:hypothetical protein